MGVGCFIVALGEETEEVVVEVVVVEEEAVVGVDVGFRFFLGIAVDVSSVSYPGGGRRFFLLFEEDFGAGVDDEAVDKFSRC